MDKATDTLLLNKTFTSLRLKKEKYALILKRDSS